MQLTDDLSSLLFSGRMASQVDGVGHGELPNNLSEIDLPKLSSEERWRTEYEIRHEEPRGNLFTNINFILIFLPVLIVAQIILVKWKRRNFKSYQKATLLGMWLIPIGISLSLFWLRFCILWAIFSAITALVTFKASRKPLSGSTPRWVYKWFLLLYKVSYASGILGYLILATTIFSLNNLLLVETKTVVHFSLHMVFYGLYFGVVSRDFAEVCADTMAAHVGDKRSVCKNIWWSFFGEFVYWSFWYIIRYYSSTGFPAKRLDTNTCAVCGNEIFLMSNDSMAIEKTVKLTCGHVFHEFCIRGWCIVGKKQTCPYCKEKVDLKRMFPGPWERTHMMYGTLLDWIRNLVAWQPIILGVVEFFRLLFGFEKLL